MSSWKKILFNYDDLPVLSYIPNMVWTSSEWLWKMGSIDDWLNILSCAFAVLVISILVSTGKKLQSNFDG